METLAQPDLFPDARSRPEEDPNSRYTPRNLILGLHRQYRFTVDAASALDAPSSQVIGRFWSRIEDGLFRSWAGERLWVNPPFDDIERWVRKAWLEADAAELIVMLLPANRTEQPWFHELVEPYRDNRPARPLLATPPVEQADLRQFILGNSTPDAEGCWIWQRYTLPKGHGRIRWNDKMELAHRLAYRAWVAEPGEGQVCHRCDVPSCVNPSHLFLGTHADNMRDRNAKGRTARGATAARSLPRETVQRMKQLAEEGVDRSDIARILDVATSTVSRILNGKRWPKPPAGVRSPGVQLQTRFLPGRVSFGHPGNPDGVGAGSPPFGCFLLIWRRA